MIAILIDFIIIIGLWSIISISSKGPKSHETLIVIRDIYFYSKELIVKINSLVKLLIQDLIQEQNINKTKKGMNQEKKISIITETNYAEKTNELYTQPRKKNELYR